MDSPVRPTLAVLLAAGAGTRFRGPQHKLLAEIGRDRNNVPEPVVAVSLRTMVEANIGTNVIITGAVDLGDIVTTVGGDAVKVVHNSDWSTGMRSSVLVAIGVARELGCRQIVIGLADQPFVSPDAWQMVAEAPAPIAVATYDGRRGNPVKLDDSVWDEFQRSADDPDAGARNLVERHLDSVAFVACPGSDRDIDTQEDLKQWKH